MIVLKEIMNKISKLWYKVKDKFYDIVEYFRYNTNKYHRATRHMHNCAMPWNGMDMWKIEECLIDENIHYFKHHQRMVDEQYKEIMDSLTLAKRLLNIINNETDLFHFTRDLKEVKLPDGSYELEGDLGYVADVYVNSKNWYRFMPDSDFTRDVLDKMPHELYMAKAKSLYGKVRAKYTDYWWD